MVEASHIIDVVLNVSGICWRPPWVGGGRQVVGGILPEGLLASRNTRHWTVGPRGRRSIEGIPQQVDVKGILQADWHVLQINTKRHQVTIIIQLARQSCVMYIHHLSLRALAVLKQNTGCHKILNFSPSLSHANRVASPHLPHHLLAHHS